MSEILDLEDNYIDDDELETEPETESGTLKPAPIDVEIASFDPAILAKESQEIINKLIKETDASKVKDLTYLFNQNQNKKTMARVNKLNELLDAITEQALTRFTKRPDEIANKELLESLRVVNDLIVQGQKQVSEQPKPLIQINQQEVNVGTEKTLDRESKERVQNAVLKILGGLNSLDEPKTEEKKPDIIEADTTKTGE